MVKEALKSYQGFLCQCSISEYQVPWQCKVQEEQWLKLNGEQMTQLEILLKKHDEVFDEITTLPPAIASDHQIPLLAGTGPVAVRAYRYPYYQKLELEKPIREMLNTGIIRLSSSPFSSSVLVKEKMGRVGCVWTIGLRIR